MVEDPGLGLSFANECNDSGGIEWMHRILHEANEPLPTS